MPTPLFRLRPLAAALLTACLSTPAFAATFSVNSAADTNDASPGDGLCATAGGVCTLRAAIEEVNALAGNDTITFAIGSGAVTISPGSALPDITGSVIIDGYTQPGASANTLVVGNNAVVPIRLDGASAGANVYGLIFRPGSDNSVVRGLVISGFNNSGILIGSNSANLTNITIAGNFIGTDPTGADLHNFGNGVFIYDYVTNCLIGGSSPADRNVIAANWSNGLLINGVNAQGHTVRNNYIGVTPAGTAKLNNYSAALRISRGSSTFVTENVIGGGAGGIAIAGPSAYNVIVGNKIGVGADNVADVTDNALEPGIAIHADAQGTPDHTQVGGTAAGEGNTIAHWGLAGVRVTHYAGAGAFSTANAIRGNAIYANSGLGIDLSNIAAGVGVDAVNANDAGDSDTGPNGFRTFPSPG